MAILSQLGLNESFFIQFGIFCVAYLFLSRVVFTPYANALSERERRTKGGEALALELQQASSGLQNKYEQRARDISGQVKTIFDEYRAEAMKEYESLLSKARAESMQMLEAARAKTAVEFSEAQIKIQQEVGSVTQEVTKKLLG